MHVVFLWGGDGQVGAISGNSGGSVQESHETVFKNISPGRAGGNLPDHPAPHPCSTHEETEAQQGERTCKIAPPVRDSYSLGDRKSLLWPRESLGLFKVCELSSKTFPQWETPF